MGNTLQVLVVRFLRRVNQQCGQVNQVQNQVGKHIFQPNYICMGWFYQLYLFLHVLHNIYSVTDFYRDFCLFAGKYVEKTVTLLLDTIFNLLIGITKCCLLRASLNINHLSFSSYVENARISCLIINRCFY